jgi:hypothetical protein
VSRASAADRSRVVVTSTWKVTESAPDAAKLLEVVHGSVDHQVAVEHRPRPRWMPGAIDPEHDGPIVTAGRSARPPQSKWNTLQPGPSRPSISSPSRRKSRRVERRLDLAPSRIQSRHATARSTAASVTVQRRQAGDEEAARRVRVRQRLQELGPRRWRNAATRLRASVDSTRPSPTTRRRRLVLAALIVQTE